jgi:hypothetical protein
MKASIRALVRARAGQRCEYCRLHEDDLPLFPFHVLPLLQSLEVEQFERSRRSDWSYRSALQSAPPALAATFRLGRISAHRSDAMWARDDRGDEHQCRSPNRTPRPANRSRFVSARLNSAMSQGWHARDGNQQVTALARSLRPSGSWSRRRPSRGCALGPPSRLFPPPD